MPSGDVEVPLGGSVSRAVGTSFNFRTTQRALGPARTPLALTVMPWTTPATETRFATQR